MNAYLLALRHTPTILERILDDVPADRFGERVSDDRFTLLEMVCHLADFEDVYLERMRAALKTDGVEVPDIDEGERAVEKKYDCRDLQKELTVFANRRRDTVTFLEELSDEQLGHAFTKEGMGRVTIKEYLAILSGHDLYHLEQATWYLKGVHGKE
jgi:uncharacterized damage-inducible protein DinB